MSPDKIKEAIEFLAEARGCVEGEYLRGSGPKQKLNTASAAIHKALTALNEYKETTP